MPCCGCEEATAASARAADSCTATLECERHAAREGRRDERQEERREGWIAGAMMQRRCAALTAACRVGAAVADADAFVVGRREERGRVTRVSHRAGRRWTRS